MSIPAMFSMVRLRGLWIGYRLRCETERFGPLVKRKARTMAKYKERQRSGERHLTTGRTAVWQARLVLLVMINIAQLWILSATIEAALAAHYKQLIPLVIASGICWVIALTIFLWWKPATARPRRK